MVMPLGPSRTPSTLFQIKNTLEQIEYGPSHPSLFNRPDRADALISSVHQDLRPQMFPITGDYKQQP